jgi:hypothetical protein
MSDTEKNPIETAEKPRSTAEADITKYKVRAIAPIPRFSFGPYAVCERR